MSNQPLSLSGAGRPPGQLRVVAREMSADLETPVSAFLKLQPLGACILLESVESGVTLGRYSFICLKPNCTISINRHELVVTDATGRRAIPHPDRDSPLATLRGILRELQATATWSHPPLLGGVVGYVGYDFVRFFERIPDLVPDPLGLPLAEFHVVDTLLVFDHVRRRLAIMSLAEEGKSAHAEGRLAEIIAALRAPLCIPGAGNQRGPGSPPISNLTREEFCAAVRKAKQRITAGDIYQLVLSQRLHGTTAADPFTIYRALRMLNPSPYTFYLDFDHMKLIGSSPEAFVRLENGIAALRPIAGTRPRGGDEAEDRQLGEQLQSDEKERAEHVMLVDLGRNDLGRCCEFGTITVTDLMKVERYSHVMHLTSHVSGKLRADLDQFDLFRAAFPAGTVAGAPKIKAMSLIEELENVKRGPYAGAVGYFSLSGDTDWCITIRTIVMKGREFFLQAGAGIVADSIPENEYEETNNKIAALVKAIELAEGDFL